MYCLVGKCRKFDLSVEFQIELFDTLVLPIITYGCEVWELKIYTEAENLIKTFYKIFLNVKVSSWLIWYFQN